MTTVRMVETKNFDALAKRYAELVAGCVDNPMSESVRQVRVPVENMYRMLEMYRYNAFESENKRGVLALNSLRKNEQTWRPTVKWHITINKALNTAFESTLSELSTEDGVKFLQGVLRDLMTSDAHEKKNDYSKTADFFRKFSSALSH